MFEYVPNFFSASPGCKCQQAPLVRWSFDPPRWLYVPYSNSSLTFAAYIKGTVNDPAEYPKPNAAHGSYHWAFERVIAASLIPLFAAATVKHGACGMLDASLSVALLLHSHMGFEQVLIDYVESRKFPKAGPIAKWILRAATLSAAVGLYGTYSAYCHLFLTQRRIQY